MATFSDVDVAQLLVEDAKSLSQTGGWQGMSRPRPTEGIPKPNMRFLRNIIRDTDDHNTALLARQAHEARARMRRLRRNSDETLTSSKSDKKRKDRYGESRSHRSNDIDDGEAAAHDRARRSRARTNESPDLDYRHKEDARRHKKRRECNDAAVQSRQTRNGDRDVVESRHRQEPSHTVTREGGTGRRRRHKSRERKSLQRRHGSDNEQGHSSRNRKTHHYNTKLESNHEAESYGHNKSRSLPVDTSEAADSDPLESIIGPLPTSSLSSIKKKGRGSMRSGEEPIDSHFRRSYDPRQDTQADPDIAQDDWDQALEALRDRQKWQRQGAERLKSAGFSEEEIKKWHDRQNLPKDAGEDDVSNVKWRGRGEKREWDRGKTLKEDFVETAAEWGRLDGL